MSKNKIRRQCSYCYKKRYVEKMVLVHYPLIKRTAFHCVECFEKFDNLSDFRYLNKLST
jgi:hypothetical protein